MSNDDFSASVEAEVNRELARSMVREFVKAKKRVYLHNDRIGAELCWRLAESGRSEPFIRVERWGFESWVGISLTSVEDEIYELTIRTSDHLDLYVIPNDLLGTRRSETRREPSPPILSADPMPLGTTAFLGTGRNRRKRGPA